MDPTTLKKNPIREALIDIKYKIDGIYSEAMFADVIDDLSPNYPTKEKQLQFESAIEISAGKANQKNNKVSTKESGILLKKEDGSRVIQIRDNGFTYNCLKPYPGWEEFLHDGTTIWNKINKDKPEVRATRIGLRYINAIPLPQKGDLSEYLTASPDLPIKDAQISGVFSRIIFKKEQNTGGVTITLESRPQQPLTLVIDIDVFRDVQPDIEFEKALSILGSLRDLKNEIFFASLTEKTLEGML